MDVKSYFRIYLRDVAKVSTRSVEHYLTAINVISNFLCAQGLISESIYEIDSIDQLNRLKSFLYTNQDFLKKNSRGNQMYSVGFNHYLDFAVEARHFGDVKNHHKLDIPIPAPKETSRTVFSWSRDRIICKQVLAMAHYCCELDPTHKSFIAESTNRNYVEGHHIIPMAKQKLFNYNLDVYANIISLCPICHRLLHFGKKDLIYSALDKIYFSRQKRFEAVGLSILRDDFISIIVN